MVRKICHGIFHINYSLKRAEYFFLKFKRSLRQTSAWNRKCQSEQLKRRNLEATQAESCGRECLGSAGCTSEPVSMPWKWCLSSRKAKAKTLSGAVMSCVLRGGVTWASCQCEMRGWGAPGCTGSSSVPYRILQRGRDPCTASEGSRDCAQPLGWAGSSKREDKERQQGVLGMLKVPWKQHYKSISFFMES